MFAHAMLVLVIMIMHICASRLACNIKVFKDKGAERKQRQEQSKMERLTPQEQANYRRSQNVTTLHPVEFAEDTVITMTTKQATPTSLPQASEG